MINVLTIKYCFNSILCVPSVKSLFMVIVIMKGKAWLTVKLTTMRYSEIKDNNLSNFPRLVNRSFLNTFLDEFDLPLDKNNVT